MKSSRFIAWNEYISDITLRTKRGDRVLGGFANNLFPKISRLPGVICGLIIVKRSGRAKTWTSFGFVKQDHSSSQVTELENVSYHSYDHRNYSRLSIAHASSTACSDLITSSMKVDICKSKGETIELVFFYNYILLQL